VWSMWRHNATLFPACGRASTRDLSPTEFVALMEFLTSTEGVRQIVDPSGDTQTIRAGASNIFSELVRMMPDLRRTAEEEEGA
jgi:hypothetical protein